MIDYDIDQNGIATLTWNMVDAGTNILSQASMAAFSEAVDKATADDSVSRPGDCFRSQGLSRRRRYFHVYGN